jgi:PilZ domain
MATNLFTGKASPAAARVSPDELAVQERLARLKQQGRVEVVLIRDADAMRIGLRVGLKRISAAGLAVVSPVALPVGEQIKVRLRHEIQRLVAEIRGAVRSVTETNDGRYLTEIELYSRLLPLDVIMLRRSGATDSVRVIGKTQV